MIRLAAELLRNRSALLTLLQFHLKSSVSGTRLGYLWWFIDPLLLMAIYYFLVHFVLGRGGPDYHLFVLSGIVPWQCFSRALRLSSRAISSNRALIRQVGMPLPAIVAIPIAVQMLVGSIGVAIVIAWSRLAPGLHDLAFVPLMALIGLYAYGIALFLCVSEVHFRDTNEILAYVLRAGFLLTPILYPASRIVDSEHVPPAAKLLFQANPMAWAITSLRDLVLAGALYEWRAFAGLLAAALLLVQCGLLWMRAQAPRIVKML